MLFETVKKLSEEEFQRATGTKKKVFDVMVDAVRKGFKSRKTKRGKVSQFSEEDQILILLEYYKEYRTMFHMGLSYGVHETTIGRMVHKIEDLLMKDGRFNLANKKEMGEAGEVVIDVMEIKIERPKKSKR